MFSNFLKIFNDLLMDFGIANYVKNRLHQICFSNPQNTSYTHTYIHRYIDTYINTYIDTYIHVYTYMYTRTYIYI